MGATETRPLNTKLPPENGSFPPKAGSSALTAIPWSQVHRQTRLLQRNDCRSDAFVLRAQVRNHDRSTALRLAADLQELLLVDAREVQRLNKGIRDDRYSASIALTPHVHHRRRVARLDLNAAGKRHHTAKGRGTSEKSDHTRIMHLTFAAR